MFRCAKLAEFGSSLKLLNPLYIIFQETMREKIFTPLTVESAVDARWAAVVAYTYSSFYI